MDAAPGAVRGPREQPVAQLGKAGRRRGGVVVDAAAQPSSAQPRPARPGQAGRSRSLAAGPPPGPPLTFTEASPSGARGGWWVWREARGPEAGTPARAEFLSRAAPSGSGCAAAAAPSRPPRCPGRRLPCRFSSRPAGPPAPRRRPLHSSLSSQLRSALPLQPAGPTRRPPRAQIALRPAPPAARAAVRASHWPSPAGPALRASPRAALAPHLVSSHNASGRGAGRGGEEERFGRGGGVGMEVGEGAGALSRRKREECEPCHS